MGHDGKKPTSDSVDNNFNIEKGLVAKRRDELLLAKISALVEADKKDTEVINQREYTPTESATRLTHPTQSRPIPHHKPPTRFQRQFFSENQENQGEESHSDSNLNVIDQIKKAIDRAKDRYESHIKTGKNPRHESGWLTGWRHGSEGIDKAAELSEQIKGLDAIDSMILNLSHFFMDDKTRYNNHSFASYLLDELNSVIENGSLSSYRPAGDASYDKFSWVKIAGQLRILSMDKEEMVSSFPGLSNN
ncbi:hypothetical protein [Legionella quateirensis]|uniref:Uncharacterized protein n=1 Tax=Legionella quateirensis TaxID=45072 RepID=A0A378KYI1_9GAMM|nr:hypothetical protein [Legionella quateirensis]KTD54730.1 hypothetical protein Lqua_0237 [Legionella quateirensis]STY16910.1 Uncharacterised protein [Legionella quateirensis]